MNTYYNPCSLAGKTVLVTGASSGIGKATAIECAKAGAQVVITGRDENRLDETFSEMTVVSECVHKKMCGDLTDAQFRGSLVEAVKGQMVQGVALCAGAVSVAPISFASIEKIMDIFSMNLFANVDIIRLLLRKKSLKRSSSVVAVTSVLGIDGYMNGNAAYGSSKAALESWIKNCALEYSSKGVRFNTIHPGVIKTPMLNLSSVTDEQINDTVCKIPVKRIGHPEEIARPIVFLLSDASSFMTGSSMVVDGGQHLSF